LRTAGCRREAVPSPQIFFAPVLRRGFSFVGGVSLARCARGRDSACRPRRRRVAFRLPGQ
jgi:hypothetical protein